MTWSCSGNSQKLARLLDAPRDLAILVAWLGLLGRMIVATDRRRRVREDGTFEILPAWLCEVTSYVN